MTSDFNFRLDEVSSSRTMLVNSTDPGSVTQNQTSLWKDQTEQTLHVIPVRSGNFDGTCYNLCFFLVPLGTKDLSRTCSGPAALSEPLSRNRLNKIHFGVFSSARCVSVIEPCCPGSGDSVPISWSASWRSCCQGARRTSCFQNKSRLRRGSSCRECGAISFLTQIIET